MEASRSVRQAPSATLSGRARVLVVDDERPIRDVVAEALRETGYEVETAANAAEALQRIAGLRPAVIEELLATVERAIAPGWAGSAASPTAARAAKTSPGQQLIS